MFSTCWGYILFAVFSLGVRGGHGGLSGLVDTDDPLDGYGQINCERTDSTDYIDLLLNDEMTTGLKVIHINIRSYFKNIDNLLIILQDLTTKYDIIALSETWLDGNKQIYDIDGYDYYVTTDNWNRNDGVLVYVRSDIPALSRQITLGEARALELTFTTDNRQYNILTTYRSPSMNFHSFAAALQSHYSKTVKGTTYLFMGDTNIDISHNVINSIEKDLYLDILLTAGFSICIDKPTRVTAHSETCIDHIFIIHPDHQGVTAAVYECDITDHYATMVKVNYSDRRTADNTINTYVDKKVLDGLLGGQRWDDVLAENDVNKCCDRFLAIFEQCTTLATKNKSPNTRMKKLKPWITLDLIKQIRKRNKLSKLVKAQPFNQNIKMNYQNFRNELSKKINRVKFEYYKNKILHAGGNSKQFWDTVKEIGGKIKRGSGFPVEHFLPAGGAGGGAVSGVADSFNKYFSEVGEKLASELPPPAVPPVVGRAGGEARAELRLGPVSEDQVVECVMGMRGGSAPGMDNIYPSTLKSNIKCLVRPLTHIVNISITNGIFPSSFKIAKVIPLYKSKDKSLISNYRPISLLSVVAKVIERCVRKQLQFFLENNNLLSNRQYGFRKGRNTTDALFHMNKNIIDSINKNKKVLVTFIDLAKAFDSIDRKLLFQKLVDIGIRNTALDWFKSYLSDRKQVVTICGKNSEPRDVNYGVIQGSNLGPLLFLIYINNLDTLNISGLLYLFADDTAIVSVGSTWPEVFDTASRDLFKIKTWFDDNILTMNVDKTKCMPIVLRAGGEPPADLVVKLHSCGDTASTTCLCQAIERVTHYRYLGVELDCNLKWDTHISILRSNVRKMIFAFYQLGHILNECELKITYYAFVQSRIQYGIIAWGGAHKTFIDRLSITQKAILKAGLHKNRRYSTDELFSTFNILTIRQLFVRTLLLYSYTNRNIFFTLIAHNYITRNSQDIGIQVPRVFKSINYTSPFYIANILQRNVPAEIREARVSVTVYKRLITAWLLGLGPDLVESLIRPIYAPV